MIKIIRYIILLALCTLITNTALAQAVQQNELSQPNKPIKFSNKIIFNPEEPNPQFGDIKFGYNINSALLANQLIRSAYQRKLDNWRNRQENILKEEIENQLNQNFPNFNEAQKAYFTNLELNNTNKHIGSIENSYNWKVNRGMASQKAVSTKIKALILRKNEIYNGNIDNSTLDNLTYKGMSIGSLKNSTTINSYISREKGNYIDAAAYQADARMISQILSGIRNVNSNRRLHYSNYMYEQQMQHYRQFSLWERVDLMQLYLNNVRISPPLISLSPVQAKDFAYPHKIKQYATANKGMPSSIFHPDYPMYMAGSYIGSSRDRYEALDRAEQEVEILRQEEIDRILSNVEFSTIETQFLIDDLQISISSSEAYWLFQNEAEAKELIDFANDNRVQGTITDAALNIIKGQIELELLTSNISLKWNLNPGKINGREDQKYTHTYTDGIRGYYLMDDKSVVMYSPQKLILGQNDELVSLFTSEGGNDGYWYIQPSGSSAWYNYLIQPHKNLSDDLRLLFELGAKDLATILGRYVLPVEDIKIIIHGKDFDGQDSSRWLAAGMLIVDVAGGKIFKAVSFVDESIQVWRVTSKHGDTVYTTVVRAISDNVFKRFSDYTQATKKLINDALRKGELTEDIINEVSEVVADLAAKEKRKLTWPEVKALFKRGNDFNKKAVESQWYPYYEIHLANGKRLDSYDSILGEIISRKATNLGNIKFSTFENYLKELVSKYKVGTKIRSNKYKDALDGKLLAGDYILEIPSSNATLPNIQSFIDYAWSNYNVKIRFRPE